jgi:HD superfamily phosphohydrolase
MLNVKDDCLVVEEKGIYSVEKFIVARRLMYWQVYLHKTGLVAENILVKVLKRAKELASSGKLVPASSALKYFLENPVNNQNFTSDVLNTFSRLDDYDVLSAIKEWTNSEDKLLSLLSKALIDRKLFKVIISNEKFDSQLVIDTKKKITDKYKLSETEIDYFFITDSVSNQAYNSDKDQIQILYKNKTLKDIAEASDHLNLQSLSTPVIKYFMCYPKSSF